MERTTIETSPIDTPASAAGATGVALEPALYLDPAVLEREQREDLRAHLAARRPRRRSSRSPAAT